MPSDDAEPAIARPTQCGDARQASRSAISVKPIGKASVDTHVGTPSAMIVAGRALGEHERRAADGEHHRDRGAGEAADDVRDVGDAALGQELAGGEREQLALARGDRGAEQADPEREVQRERRRRRECRC